REVGGDAAGTDVRATNAVLAQFVVERTRKANLGELGSAVDGLVREAAAARLRGERHDVTLSMLEEVRKRRPHRIERSLHVHVDHLLELFAGELEEGSVSTD